MIKRWWVLCVVFTGMTASLVAQQPQKLWYKAPAAAWTEALPLGNGRLGAMVFAAASGKNGSELNEATLWTGGPARTNVNPDAYKNLQLVRDALLKDENYSKAYELTKKIQGYYSESYLPLGDLIIRQSFKDAAPSAYYRDLNISDAVSTTRFTIDGTEFTRQVFVSGPDQVIAIRFTSNKPGRLNFSVGIRSQLKSEVYTISNNIIGLKGKAPSHLDPNYVHSEHPGTESDTAGCRGMRFQGLVKAVGKDGTITTDSSGIVVQNASDVLVISPIRRHQFQ